MGKFDDAVLWDVHNLQWVGALLLRRKAQIRDDESLCPFTTHEVLKKFREVTKELGIPWATRYHARHKGASWDAAQGTRTLEDIQARGGWAAHASAMRYNKGGCVQMQWTSLHKKARSYMEGVKVRLQQHFLGALKVPDPPALPKAGSWRGDETGVCSAARQATP